MLAESARVAVMPSLCGGLLKESVRFRDGAQYESSETFISDCLNKSENLFFARGNIHG